MNKEKKLINTDKEQLSRLIKALDSDEEVWDAVGGYNPNLSLDGLLPEGNETAGATTSVEEGVDAPTSTTANAKGPIGSPTPQSHPSSSSDSSGWLSKVANRTAAALKGILLLYTHTSESTCLNFSRIIPHTHVHVNTSTYNLSCYRWC